MIDLKNVYEIRNVIDNKVIEKIEDDLGNIIYEAWKKLIASGVPPITLQKCKGANLVDYKIYGDSVQDGAPTPDNPIEVESVGEKTNNLLDEKLLGQEEGYNTYENGMWTTSALGSYGRDLFYNVVGTNHNVDINKVPKVTPSTTITGKFYDYINNGINMTYTLYIGFYDSEGTYISRTTVNPSKVFTIEIPENVHYISFFRSSNYGTISFSHIQIVEGSYTATTMPAYEPYGYKIPVTVKGKNELDYKKFIKEGKTFEIENGIQYEPLSGTQNVTFDFTFKANTTYVLSGIVTGNLYFGGQLQTTTSDNPLSTYTWLTSTGSSLKIRNTSNEDLTRTLYCRLLNGTPDVISTIKNLQLEVAETKTDYEPYVAPITTNIYLDNPLRKIEDYTDYIDFINQKVIRNIGFKLLDGSEYWSLSNDATDFTQFSAIITGSENNSILADILPAISVTERNSNNGVVKYSGNGVRVSLLKSEYPDVLVANDFKNWITLNNIKYYFRWTTPIEEDITLPNIPTHKGTTIIEVDTSILPSNMEVKYYGKE